MMQNANVSNPVNDSEEMGLVHTGQGIEKANAQKAHRK